MEHNDFYVYEHREADTGRVFYIGRGRGKRWMSTGARRSKWWRRIVNAHGGFVSIKVYEGLTINRANELEEMLISAYGRENLCNLTDGGDGCKGLVHTEEWKKMMSERMTGRVMTEEWREKISASRCGDKHVNWGKRHKDETIKGMHGHGSNDFIVSLKHKDGDEFLGTVNEWMHEFHMKGSDAKNMSRHVHTGRYTHVKGWRLNNGTH